MTANFKANLTKEFEQLSSQIDILKQALTNNNLDISDDIKQKIEEIAANSKTQPQNNDNNPLLKEAFSRWLDFNKDRIRKRSLEQTYKPIINFFIDTTNHLKGKEVRTNELEANHIRQFIEIYSKIPRRAKIKGLPFEEILNLTGPLKSKSTILQNITNVGTFLLWCSHQAYDIDNTLTKLLTKGNNIHPTQKDLKKRVPFSDADLSTLFHSLIYTKSTTCKPSMYWTPLIALFTGARMSEILQLEAGDIRKESEIWIIDFNESNDIEEKWLKTKGSSRKVPIHKTLIKLGFIEFSKTKKGKLLNEERDKHGKFDKFQKSFSYYRKKHKVNSNNEREMKDFHSFRHTVRTRLSEICAESTRTKIDSGIIDAILGHESQNRSIGEKVYDHSENLKLKQKLLNKLEYHSINFDSIIKWNRITFKE